MLWCQRYIPLQDVLWEINICRGVNSNSISLLIPRTAQTIVFHSYLTCGVPHIHTVTLQLRQIRGSESCRAGRSVWDTSCMRPKAGHSAKAFYDTV